MAHSISLNNRISCVVVISIFGFQTYWKQAFDLMQIQTSSTFEQFLQAYCCIFVVWSLPARRRLSVAWRRIVDSMTCSYWRWVFLLARTVKTLTLFLSPSNRTLVSSVPWTQRWILPPHKRSYCLGSCYAPSSCVLAQHMLSHFSLIRFLRVKNMQWLF